MRAILAIEYGYVRLSANIIALQALAEKCEQIAKCANVDVQAAILTAYHDNEKNVNEVIHAAQSVLVVALDELLPENNLKFMPVRVYCRILNSAVALWKVR